MQPAHREGEGGIHWLRLDLCDSASDEVRATVQRHPLDYFGYAVASAGDVAPRDDIGERWAEDSDRLHNWGYLR
jgi:hypothetical protein